MTIWDLSHCHRLLYFHSQPQQHSHITPADIKFDNNGVHRNSNSSMAYSTSPTFGSITPNATDFSAFSDTLGGRRNSNNHTLHSAPPTYLDGLDTRRSPGPPLFSPRLNLMSLPGSPIIADPDVRYYGPPHAGSPEPLTPPWSHLTEDIPNTVGLGAQTNLPLDWALTPQYVKHHILDNTNH